MTIYLKKNRELHQLYIFHPTSKLDNLLDNIENDDDIEKYIICMINCYKKYNSKPNSCKSKKFKLASFFFNK